jgi:hypothetical protein
MFPKPPQCGGCPFEHRGQGYVPGEGPPDARWAIVGQGPGGNEVALGRPFFDAWGRAGSKLTRQLEYAQLDRRTAWVDNAVRCLIKTKGQDVAPDRAVAECWQRHVGPTLHALHTAAEARGEPLWVVWVGVPAMRLGMGKWANASCVGSLVSTTLRPLDSTMPTEVGEGDPNGHEQSELPAP